MHCIMDIALNSFDSLLINLLPGSLPGIALGSSKLILV